MTLKLSEEESRVSAWGLRRLLDGRFDDWNGPARNPDGAQCVNIPNEYRRMRGRSMWDGNASDWYGRNMPGASWKGTRLSSVIKAGDVLVWPDSEDRPNGHAALVLDGGRVPEVLVLQQNSPDGAPVGIAWVRLDGVVGHMAQVA